MDGIQESMLTDFIKSAIAEDVGAGDFTSLACIPKNQRSRARLLVKDVGVIAGVELAGQIFKYLDPECRFEVFIPDGTDVVLQNEVFEIECNTQALLGGERLVLNLMQRMSGIATISSRFALEIEGIPVTILDTRKTTPLLRFLEKWAVRIGGCTNYREGLYDRIMIKDNHIEASGGVENAIESVNAFLKDHQLDLKITIEVRNLVELYQTLNYGFVDRIMLDNFEIPLLREAVAIIDGRFETEASGGVSLRNVRKIAKTGVEYISVGALTHSAGCLDLSLKIK